MAELSQNPFTITFGKYPLDLIQRHEIYDQIITSFNNKEAGTPLYILVGARGSGKTVCMTTIANHYKDDKEWIVVDLNPHQDLLEQLAASLYQKGKLMKLFIKKEFSFSFHGLSFSLSGDEPIASVSTLLDLMFSYLKKKGISVLINIDEANNNEHMRVFAHQFQYFLRQGYRVDLLMTGLYENISSLENVKSLTFLYRAPKIYLPPLNIRAIAYSYIDLLQMEEDDAIEAAKITKGYAFAYQLLGHILFERKKKKVDERVIREFDLALDEKSYSKIFSELSPKEREIASVLADGASTNEEVMNALNIKSNALAVYKQQLSKKGIIDTSERGAMTFALPRFKEFVLFHDKL